MVSPHLDRLRTLTNELSTQERVLDSFFQSSLDLFSITTPEGVFKKLNPAWEEVLGWSCKELMSQPFIELCHPEDLDRTIEEFNSLLDSDKRVYYLRNRYRCKDGSYKILCWTARYDVASNLIFAIARDYSAMMDKVTE